MKTILSLLTGAVFLVIAGAPCCRGAAIKPDPAIQKDIDDVVVQLGGNISSLEEAESLIQGFEARHTNAVVLVEQIMYYSRFGVSSEQRGYGMIYLMSKIGDAASKTTAALDQLDSPNPEFRKIAASLLSEIDSAGRVTDFSRYEPILRKEKPDIPEGLIRYMFNEDPSAAIRTASRVYGRNVSETEIQERVRAVKEEFSKGPKPGERSPLEYFVDRPEWWSHLYAAVVLKKHAEWKPVLIEKLASETNVLVRQVVTEIGSKR